MRRAFPDATIEVATANLLHADGLLQLAAGVDVAIHCAAGMRGAPTDLFANTVVGTRHFLDAAGTAGVGRIALVSSLAVYQTSSLRRGALVDARTPLEPVGVERGAYAYAKRQQELVFAELQTRYGFEAIVLRPGIIYGREVAPLHSRVGLELSGRFFSLGGDSPLPVTYIDNCADAIVHATLHAPPGRSYNIVDDDLPSCREYLHAYQRSIRPLRTWAVPYPLLSLGARALAWYHRRSNGQLPQVLTPYVVRSTYRPFRYSNTEIKSLGWEPAIPTATALALTLPPAPSPAA